ncbi:MAG: hypothetical protein ACRDRI_21825 [Pseudonocardiaceae bacterium]
MSPGSAACPRPPRSTGVRDDLTRTWRPGPEGRYSAGESHHHATGGEVRARHDLVEVLTEAEVAETTLGGTQ